MIQSIGEAEFGPHDSANIPCNIFIAEIDREDEYDLQRLREHGVVGTEWTWRLTADLFMPRKGKWSDAYEYVATSKEELNELVRKHVLPSYQIALDAVTAMSEGRRDTFYYWSPEHD